MSPLTLNRGRRLLSGATVAALAAGVLALAPTSAQAADGATPTVTVSKVAFAPDETATITVQGTGFDPSAALGTRPPFPGQPGGAYVILGYFADDWRPSAGAPSSTRKVISQKWALPAGQYEALEAGGAFELRADGSFETSIAVEKAQLDTVRAANPTLDGNFGIYTYPGSGATNAGYETFTPVSFVPAAPVATNVTTKYAKGGTVTVTAPLAASVRLAGVGTKTATAGQKVTFALPRTLTAGTRRLAVTFTPADTGLSPSTSTVTVKIAKVAAYKAKFKVNKKPTRKAKGKATVSVRGVAGGAATTGKVRLKLSKGKTNRYVNVNLVKGKRTVALPKLAKGTWTVRAAYYGNTNYAKRGYVKVGSFKVTK